VREQTPHTRLFLNLNAEVKEGLFAIPRTPAQRARRKARAAAPFATGEGNDHPYDVF
jgi:hypothetical protein